MNEDQEIRRLYQDHLRGEILSQNLFEQKRNFIRSHFPHQPLWRGPFGLVAPAFALGLLFLVFSYRQFVRIERQQEVLLPPPVLSQDVSQQNDMAERGVRVRRLSSQVGATMVYQKSHGNVPVTIIWVFPGGSS